MCLRLTQSGWVVSGASSQSQYIPHPFVGCTLQELSVNLEKFWRVEDYAACEKNHEVNELVEHFENNHQIGRDGKFVVRLPIQKHCDKIHDNRNLALRSLHRVEHRCRTTAGICSVHE